MLGGASDGSITGGADDGDDDDDDDEEESKLDGSVDHVDETTSNLDKSAAPGVPRREGTPNTSV